MLNMLKMILKFIWFCIGFWLVDFICLLFNSKYCNLIFFCIFFKILLIVVIYDIGFKEIWDDFMNGFLYLCELVVFFYKLLVVLNI